MTFLNEPHGSLGRAVSQLRPRVGLVLVSALLFALTGWMVASVQLGLILYAVSATLALAGLWILVLSQVARMSGGRTLAVLRDVIEHDGVPCVVAGADGTVLAMNTTAARDLGSDGTGTLAALLQSNIANPGAVLYRLESRAEASGFAQEDLVTRQGHVRVGVTRVSEDRYLWRVEKSADMVSRRGDPVPLPMITVGRNDAVLFMNQAARDLVGQRALTLDRICAGLPMRSGQLNDIHTEDGPRPCLVVELEGTAGRREVFLLPGVAPAERQPDGWAFFDELPVPLLKLSASGEVQLSNRHARELLGADVRDGAVFSDLVEGLGRPIPDWLGDVAAGRGSGHSEFLRIRRDDREAFAQVTLNRAKEDGETILIAVLTDATELKSLEAQFVQSQKMQAIGQLAGGVAHDFNNLLTAITGHCDLLLLRHEQGDSDYSDLLQINQNANRAAALVNQLLAFSRKQTLRPEIMDLRDAMSDLTHLLNRLVGAKVELSLSHDPDLWSIRADKRQLEQVVMNLVVNARDATPGGGAVRIKTENVVLEEPLMRDRATVAAGRYVKVSVVDEGEGIAPDLLRKVFEPFFTTKRMGEGTGLGLSTAYGIVKQTGGFIFADSVVGEGSTFFLLFPAHDPAPAAVPVERDAAVSSEPVEGVVLLVEDEAPVRAFASRALQMRGFTVVEADSAEDALDILEDTDLAVDVFVTDVVMPGMDGPSWVLCALQDRPEVKVVFMSGYAEEDFGEAQAKIPNSVFLPKPFSLTDLTEVVQRQLA